MPTRTRVSTAPIVAYSDFVTVTRYPIISESTETGIPIISSYKSKMMDDSVTPGWKREQGKTFKVNPVNLVTTDGTFDIADYRSNQVVRLLPGLALQSDQSSYYTNGRSAYFDMAAQRVGDSVTGSHNIMARAGMFYPLPVDLMESVRNGVYAKAAETPMLILVTAAEAKKTLELCESLTKRIHSFCKWLFRYRISPDEVNDYQKITRKSLRRSLIKGSATLASQWLEYRYGIMPLVYELQGAIELLKGGSQAYRVTYGAAMNPSPVSTDTGWAVQGDFIESRTTSYRKISSRCNAGLFVRARSTAELSGINRLGSTAWELIPFSFIADWFVDVNERIAAAEGYYSRDIIAGWETYVVNGQFTYLRHDRGRTWDDAYRGYRFDGGSNVYIGSGTELTRRYVRAPIDSFSAAPGFRVNLNWKRFTDLAALARGSLTRARTRI